MTVLYNGVVSSRPSAEPPKAVVHPVEGGAAQVGQGAEESQRRGPDRGTYMRMFTRACARASGLSPVLGVL